MDIGALRILPNSQFLNHTLNSVLAPKNQSESQRPVAYHMLAWRRQASVLPMRGARLWNWARGLLKRTSLTGLPAIAVERLDLRRILNATEILLVLLKNETDSRVWPHL